jgi:hypothetical protein
MKRAFLLALMVLLVSGCVEQAPSAPVCARPYILVGTECCLDENGDGVCDRDKPVCTKPYILVGNDCCLDIDGNGICDRDQSTTTATAVTTTTERRSVQSTTTTMSVGLPEENGSGCVSVYDCLPYYRLRCDEDNRVVNITYGPVSCAGGLCRYRQTQDIGATHCYDWETCVDGACLPKEQTTTTTVSYTTTTMVYINIQKIVDRVATRAAEISAYMATTTSLPPLGCYDSDGGIKYNIRSDNVTGLFEYNDTHIWNAAEFCRNTQTLIEYFCRSNQVASFVHECPSWCIDGRCCGGAGNSCESNRDCCSGACRMVGLTNHCV